ncbi:hypothetical protein LTR62_004894 [Meristemomyces frigidus]|uniref:Heterokaryon incompatibility domain-containing protein n=1 Tax=Meristemomyces frigidus TaxID=1508187 RepID=A0AAN7YJK7_9PEZI|nr:hypothetical protein LTR62_004894 [Meristemomyces frigidus]
MAHPLDVPLLPPSLDIRLAELQAGAPSDPIFVRISFFDLEKCELPRFDALSYVWGSVDREETIECHDTRRQIRITASLHAALSRVRYRDQPRHIWADAICINQENLAEKSHHVAFMDRVYAKATKVLVCMGGDESGEASEVVALLNEHASRMGVKSLQDMPLLASNDPVLDDARWRSLAKLTRNDWFKRAWVVQEVGKAREARVLWGNEEFSYRRLMQLGRWIDRCAPLLIQRAGAYLLPIHTDWERWTPEWRANVDHDYTLIDFFSYAKGLGCRDPRDNVYSLLGHPLARTAADKPLLMPNYEVPIGEVLMELSSYMLRTLGLKTLSSVEHDNSTILEDLPSWITRWDMDLTWRSLGYYPDFYYRASGPEPEDPLRLWKPTFSASAPSVLAVQAAYLDTIDAVFPFPLVDEQGTESSDRWKNIFRFWDLGTAEEVASSAPRLVNTLVAIHRHLTARLFPAQLPDALSLTLCAGLQNYLEVEASLGSLETHRADFQAFWQLIESSAYSKLPSSGGDAEASWAEVNLACKGRCFFTTSKGYCGLGPLIAQPNDICYVFNTARVPFVVRAMESGKSRLLGEAYVHDFMHGELLYQSGKAVQWNRLDLY